MMSDVGLLFIEPQNPASEKPVIDELACKMAAALTASTPSKFNTHGVHFCICGAHSDTRNYVVPNEAATNTLCVHYLAYHRDEVPQSQLDRVAALDVKGIDPPIWMLKGGYFQ